MTEYWKSNPRKFCDFCKCWIAENKPSIEFHERGKRHKENVQKRLEEIGRKGQEDYETKLKLDDYMKEMEEAALKAYQKDIQNNPDMLAKTIVAVADAKNATIVVIDKPQVKEISLSKKSKKKIAKWMEAKSPEGYSYYWNIETNGTVWEAPAEGFLSLNEQNVLNEKKNTPKDTPVFGPAPKAEAYSPWETVKEPTYENHLELPELPEEDYYVPEVVYKKPEIIFKEKTVTLSGESISGNLATTFKRKKNVFDHKRNVRKRPENL